jgi:hypothetical protein
MPCNYSVFPMSYVLCIFPDNDKLCSLQRFYMVKPCPKDMKCDVEVSVNLTTQHACFELMKM